METLRQLFLPARVGRLSFALRLIVWYPAYVASGIYAYGALFAVVFIYFLAFIHLPRLRDAGFPLWFAPIVVAFAGILSEFILPTDWQFLAKGVLLLTCLFLPSRWYAAEKLTAAAQGI